MTAHRARKKLPHEVPGWVPQGSRHFITVNCRQREKHILTDRGISRALLKSAEHYEAQDRWHIWVMVIMPDHLHLIATFNLDHGIKPTVSAWKRYQSRNLQITWQEDFFEHRLRDENEFTEKAFYVRMNPVRKGLVEKACDWPHSIDRMGYG